MCCLIKKYSSISIFYQYICWYILIKSKFQTRYRHYYFNPKRHMQNVGVKEGTQTKGKTRGGKEWYVRSIRVRCLLKPQSNLGLQFIDFMKFSQWNCVKEIRNLQRIWFWFRKKTGNHSDETAHLWTRIFPMEEDEEKELGKKSEYRKL